MINEHMTDSDPMRSVIAKLQADAELAADNAAAAEEAENARIWPVPEGCCPFVPWATTAAGISVAGRTLTAPS